jgi:hypothetical protein
MGPASRSRASPHARVPDRSPTHQVAALEGDHADELQHLRGDRHRRAHGDDQLRRQAEQRDCQTAEDADLAELIARTVLDNLYRFVVPALAGPARLVPLETPEVSRLALRIAAQRGRLRARRGDDGQWRSSRTWVDEYLNSRYARSPRTTDEA